MKKDLRKIHLLPVKEKFKSTPKTVSISLKKRKTSSIMTSNNRSKNFLKKSKMMKWSIRIFKSFLRFGMTPNFLKSHSKLSTTAR
mgnify:CR=1 FL=1